MINTILKFTKLNEFYTPKKCFIIEILNTSEDSECSIAGIRVEPASASNGIGFSPGIQSTHKESHRPWSRIAVYLQPKI